MQVFVEQLNGKSFTLPIDINDTIQRFKLNIEEIHGISSNFQRIFYNQNELENNQTFSYYGITNNAKLLLQLKINGGGQIFVKTLQGKTITITVEYEKSVKLLKQQIYEKTGVPIQQQRLIFAGKILEDKKSIEDYNIGRESTIHMAERLKGGN